MHALAVIYPLRDIDTISEFQVVQSAIDHVTVSVVPAAGFSAGDVRRIEDQLRLRLGQDIRVDVATTAAISRTAAAKFRYVVRMSRRPTCSECSPACPHERPAGNPLPPRLVLQEEAWPRDRMRLAGRRGSP